MARGKRGEFLMANGRAAALEAHDALAGEPISRSARSSAAPLRRESCSPRRSTPRRTSKRVAGAAIETRGRTHLRSRRRRRCAPAGAVGSARSSSPSRTLAVPADEASALGAGARRAGARRRPAAVDARALEQWRDRVMFLRRAEGDAWPDLSDEALAARSRVARARSWSARRRLDEIGADDLSNALRALLPWDARPPARRRGADPFRSADRHAGGDRLRGRGRPGDRAAGAGAVRPRRASRRWRAARSR